MKNRGRISIQGESLESLGALSAVYLDTITTDKNLDYLQYLCNTCEHLNINYFWHSKETTDNKRKLLTIFQMSIHYQAQLYKASKEANQQMKDQLRVKKLEIQKKTNEMKLFKENFNKKKEEYQKGKIQLAKKGYKDKIRSLQNILEQEKIKTKELQIPRHSLQHSPYDAYGQLQAPYPYHYPYNYAYPSYPSNQPSRQNSERNYSPSQIVPPPHGPQQNSYGPQQNPYPHLQNPYPHQQNPYPHQQNPYPPQQNPYPPQQNPYPQPQNPYTQPPQNPDKKPYLKQFPSNIGLNRQQSFNQQGYIQVIPSHRNRQQINNFNNSNDPLEGINEQEHSITYEAKFDQNINKNNESSQNKRNQSNLFKYQSSSQHQSEKDDTFGNILENTQYIKKIPPKQSMISNDSIAALHLDPKSNNIIPIQSKYPRPITIMEESIDNFGDLKIDSNSIKKNNNLEKQNNSDNLQEQKKNENVSSRITKPKEDSSLVNKPSGNSQRVPLYKMRQKLQDKKQVDLFTSNIGNDNSPKGGNSEILNMYNSNRANIGNLRQNSHVQKKEKKEEEPIDNYLYDSNMGGVKAQSHKLGQSQKNGKQTSIHININPPKQYDEEKINEEQEKYSQDFENSINNSRVIITEVSQKSKFIQIPKNQLIPIIKINKDSVSSFSIGQLQERSHIKILTGHSLSQSSDFDMIQMPEHSVIARPSKNNKSIRIINQQKNKHKTVRSDFHGSGKQNNEGSSFLIISLDNIESKRVPDNRQKQPNNKIDRQGQLHNNLNAPLVESTTIDQKKIENQNKQKLKKIEPKETESELSQIIELDAQQSTFQPLKTEIQTKIATLIHKPLSKIQIKKNIPLQNFIKKQIQKSMNKKVQQISDWSEVSKFYDKKIQEGKIELKSKIIKNSIKRQKQKKIEDDLQYSKSLLMVQKKPSVTQIQKVEKQQKKISKKEEVKYARNSKNEKSLPLNIKQNYNYDFDDEMIETIRKNPVKMQNKANNDDQEFD